MGWSYYRASQAPLAVSAHTVGVIDICFADSQLLFSSPRLSLDVHVTLSSLTDVLPLLLRCHLPP